MSWDNKRTITQKLVEHFTHDQQACMGFAVVYVFGLGLTAQAFGMALVAGTPNFYSLIPGLFICISSFLAIRFIKAYGNV